jgi:AcrR family transcriptional regulator
VSPQRSNRTQLIEGTLRCLERLPAERVTARAIADESGANLASIAYHFGSKDELVTEAVIVGLDRWLAELEDELASLSSRTPRARFRRANTVVEESRRRHAGLVPRWPRHNTTPASESSSRPGSIGHGRQSLHFSRSVTIKPARMPADWCSRSSTGFSCRFCSTRPSPSTGSAWNALRSDF